MEGNTKVADCAEDHPKKSRRIGALTRAHIFRKRYYSRTKMSQIIVRSGIKLLNAFGKRRLTYLVNFFRRLPYHHIVRENIVYETKLAWKEGVRKGPALWWDLDFTLCQQRYFFAWRCPPSHADRKVYHRLKILPIPKIYKRAVVKIPFALRKKDLAIVAQNARSIA